MTGTFTLAHISDLHLSPEYRRQNIQGVRRLLDFLATQPIDHIVITGDIAANADRRDFALARMLLSSHGLLDASRTTIIPGNHDIFGGVHTAEDILEFPSRCRKTNVELALEDFTKSFAELFQGCAIGGKGHPYPFVKDLGPVVLIGLNSVADYSVVKNPLGSNGQVTESQILKVREYLESGLPKEKTRIVLVHHHFNKADKPATGVLGGMWGSLEQQTMKLRKKRSLLEFFQKEQIDLVLHGHLHVSSSYTRKGIR
ncbi:MAG: metallophosphoesterase, partial [Bacteroidota bacterium]